MGSLFFVELHVLGPSIKLLEATFQKAFWKASISLTEGPILAEADGKLPYGSFSSFAVHGMDFPPRSSSGLLEAPRLPLLIKTINDETYSFVFPYLGTDENFFIGSCSMIGPSSFYRVAG